MKLSVNNEAKLTGLRARNCATIQKVWILKFAFGTEKFPGLSRNGPLSTRIRICLKPHFFPTNQSPVYMKPGSTHTETALFLNPSPERSKALRGVLRTSSNIDDERIPFGFEIFDFGIFLGRKIWGSLI